MSEKKPVVVVVGVGPGTGLALCKKWAAEGYAVAALARDLVKLTELCEDIEGVEPYSCDVTEATQVVWAFDKIAEEIGTIEGLLYNAGAGVFGDVDEVSADDLELSWRVNCQGLFMCVQQVLDTMRESGHGFIGITGATASLRGKPFTTAFAQAKAAQRSLAQSLARKLNPEGIHVFLAIIDGMIDLPRTRERMPDRPVEEFLAPDDIAEAYWSIAQQPRSAWTFQLDLRPHTETW